MKVQDIFDKRFEDEDVSNNQRALLKMAVDELMDEISTS